MVRAGHQVNGGSDLRLILGANIFVLLLLAMCNAAYSALF